MKRALIVTVAVVAATAWAGKPERDKQKELTPQVAEQAKAVKDACGCEVKFTVKWDTYKKADDMFRINSAAEAFATAAKSHCESPEDKKALCDNVKEVEISFAADVGDVGQKGKALQAHSNDGSYNGDGQFKAILDKF